MTQHSFNQGDYVTVRFFYSINGRAHFINLGFIVNTSVTGDPIVVATDIYKKLFRDIFYSAWSDLVVPEYILFYYGPNFLKLASLNKTGENSEINREQFLRVYFYIINREKPVSFNLYGIKKDPSFLSNIKDDISGFFKTPMTITIGGPTSGEGKSEGPTEAVGELKELKLSFPGVKQTPQILGLDEISSVSIKTLKIPKNQRELLMAIEQKEKPPEGQSSD